HALLERVGVAEHQAASAHRLDRPRGCTHRTPHRRVEPFVERAAGRGGRRLAPLDPVALALERIGGQLDAPPALALGEAVRIEARAAPPDSAARPGPERPCALPPSPLPP